MVAEEDVHSCLTRGAYLQREASWPTNGKRLNISSNGKERRVGAYFDGQTISVEFSPMPNGRADDIN
jgi:hypothetical protein